MNSDSIKSAIVGGIFALAGAIGAAMLSGGLVFVRSRNELDSLKIILSQLPSAHICAILRLVKFLLRWVSIHT